MQAMSILESLFRWIHIGAGVVWIGHLYFFNWVNANFAPTMDAETKKKVVPELMPRALYWFRWGAAFTWISGVLLLLLVFYHGGALFDGTNTWGAPAFVMIALTFLAPFVYDAILKSIGTKNMMAAIAVAYIGIVAVTYLMSMWAHFSYRGTVIHVGGMLGTIMAFNVWFRIWPAQQKIVTAIKNGQAPDAKLVGLAGLRSKQNTYLSFPLLWTMMNAHTTWAASCWYALPIVVLLGWWIVSMLYRRAAKVKGF